MDVRKRVIRAAERAGRDPRDVTLVAITKGVAPVLIEEASKAGVRDFGENRARDLESKAGAADPEIRWHFVGSLQTNKVRLLDRASLIHSLGRVREAEALQTRGEHLGRSWDVLVQVNVAGEPQKGGVEPGRVGALVDDLGAYPRVRPRGLMFVAPQVQKAEDVRAMFAEACALRDRLANLGLVELSMGMSDDFEVAVEEGSTIVRIGRSIFQGAAMRTSRGGM